MTTPQGFVLDENINIEPSEKSKEAAKGFKFYGWEPKPETIEKIRHPSGVALKGIAEGILGLPGDVLALLKHIPGLKEVPQILPTSEHIGKGFEYLANEKFTPKGLGEELLGETAAILGTLGSTGGFLPAKTLLRSLGRTGLSSFVPASVLISGKKAELPPWMTASLMIGSSLLTHRITGKSIKDIERNLYSKSKELAQNVMAKGEPIVENINKLEEIMSKGFKSHTPKTKVYALANELKAKAEGGAIPISDLMEMRSEAIKESKLMTKAERAASDKYWNMLIESIDKGIQQYEKINPEFKNVYRQANSLHKGIAESKRMENFITSNKYLQTLASSGGGIILKLLGFGSGSLATLSGIKAFNVLRAFKRNPGLRKTYQDILKNAAKEDIRSTGRAIKNFNTMIKEENLENETKIPKGFVLD